MPDTRYYVRDFAQNQCDISFKDGLITEGDYHTVKIDRVLMVDICCKSLDGESVNIGLRHIHQDMSSASLEGIIKKEQFTHILVRFNYRWQIIFYRRHYRQCWEINKDYSVSCIGTIVDRKQNA